MSNGVNETCGAETTASIMTLRSYLGATYMNAGRGDVQCLFARFILCIVVEYQQPVCPTERKYQLGERVRNYFSATGPVIASGRTQRSKSCSVT
jgi:hypothetical protein